MQPTILNTEDRAHRRQAAIMKKDFDAFASMSDYVPRFLTNDPPLSRAALSLRHATALPIVTERMPGPDKLEAIATPVLAVRRT
jgi:hypothetical protein